MQISAHTHDRIRTMDEIVRVMSPAHSKRERVWMKGERFADASGGSVIPLLES